MACYTCIMLEFFKPKNSVSISPSIAVFTTLFLLGLYFLYYIRSILTLLFLAFIIVVALNPGVNWLQRKLHLPRVLGTVTIYLLVFGVLVGMGAVILPPLSRELISLVPDIHLPVIQDELRNFSFTLNEVGQLAEKVGDSLGVALAVITNTASGVFTFFTLIVISVYMMLDRPVLYKKVNWFTKDEKHILAAKNFLDSLEAQLGGWVRGQVVLMLTIGLVTYVGLILIGVPYALPLALLAGLLEIVPNVGPTVASIPAIILAYLNLGPVMAGVTTLFYMVVQQLENNIIVPKIMKENANVNPLVALVIILMGLKLAGVVGALLAVPAYIVIRTLYRMWYDRNLAATE